MIAVVVSGTVFAEGEYETANPDIVGVTTENGSFNILLYHVVPGNVMAADVVTMSSAKAASGAAFAITAGDSGVTVAGSNVVATDIMASNGVIPVVDSASVITTDIFTSNGVIHVIDSVIIPN